VRDQGRGDGFDPIIGISYDLHDFKNGRTPQKKMKKGLKYFAALPMSVIEEEGFGYHASNSKRSACLRQPAKTSEHARSGDP
jgi:hypothetical protein